MNESAEATPPPPHSWLRLLIGLSVIGFVGVTGVILIHEFVSSRPVNLLGVSQAAAEDLEEVLVANRVPRSAIDRKGPDRREHPEAHWYFYEYDVQVPESVSTSGLETVVEQRMRAESLNLAVADYYEAGGKKGISISYGDVGVAVVRFDRPAPVRATEAVQTALPTAAPAEKVPSNEILNIATTESPDAMYSDAVREDHGSDPADDSLKGMPEDTPTESGDDAPIPSIIEIEPVGERGWRPARGVASGDAETPRAARLAIVLDDGGYGGPVTEAVLALPSGLTLAILPYTPMATETAERAAAAGFEVMLHMPMENTNPTGPPHKGQLRVDMTETEIAELTEAALDQIPHVAGVNNHQGSRFTSDAVAMARFLTALSRKPLYFIDSRTAASTKAYELATTFGMRANERDVFLDHVDEEDSIRRSLDEAIELAKAEGLAIAIGHFRELTVNVLGEVLPTLAEQGVELVHASELAR